MPVLELTRSKHIAPFCAFLAGIGEPVERLLGQAGLPSTCLDDPSTPVPTVALWRFRELAAERVGLPNITLSVIGPYRPADLGTLVPFILRAPTLLRMIEEFARLTHAESSSALLEISPRGDQGVFFSNRFRLTNQVGQWHAELYVLLWMLKIVQLVDPGWAPTTIWTSAKPTLDRVHALKSLGARPRFQSGCSGFFIPASMLALPAHRDSSGELTPDGEENHLWSTAPSGSLSGAILQLIRAYAGDGWLKVHQAAEVAGMSARTMQRGLASEGRTYSDVLAEVRATIAGEMLERTDASMSEIARELGYVDQSGFSRAFRRWASVPPTMFRAQRRGARGS